MKTTKLNVVSGSEAKDGDSVKLLCLIQSRKNHVTKKGDKMCFLTLSDETGEIDAVVFPELYKACSSSLKDDSIILVNGKISVKDESVSVICSSVVSEQEFSHMISNMRLCIKIRLVELVSNQGLMDICREFSGSTSVVFYLTDVRRMVSPKNKISIDIGSGSYSRLKEIYPVSSMGLIQ